MSHYFDVVRNGRTYHNKPFDSLDQLASYVQASNGEVTAVTTVERPLGSGPAGEAIRNGYPIPLSGADAFQFPATSLHGGYPAAQAASADDVPALVEPAHLDAAVDNAHALDLPDEGFGLDA